MDSKRPKRPRQHQLESESRVAFQSSIPSTWVYRNVDQDYGIDAEVELFDKAGNATGARFLVQLKATDEGDLRKALVLRLPQSKALYYSSLDLPVLIVRYHAPTKSQFARWFHNLDPYYARRSATGFTFRLSEEDAWAKFPPEKIAADVEAFREIRSARLGLPLRVGLSIASGTVHGIPEHQLRLRIREAARQVSHIIALEDRIGSQPLPPHAISISPERCEVRIGGAHGFTLHTPNGYADAGSTLHFDAMLAIGLALDWHGHSLTGASIVEVFWKQARLSREHKVALALARCLARANRMHSAMEMAETFFRDDSAWNAAQAYLLPFFAKRPQMSQAEETFLGVVLERMAKDAEQRGALSDAAVFNYNRGNVLRSQSRCREAVHAYHQALHLEPGYSTRQYFWSELAGVLFIARRYRMAAGCYKRSLSITNDQRTSLLYADALMFSGKYREAADLFATHLKPPPDASQAEWRLKQFALSFLRERTSIDEQRRANPPFPANFKPVELADQEIVRICNQALQTDALSGLAWFNLGGVYHRAGDRAPAAACFLLAALVVPSDLEAWGNTFGLAMQLEDHNLAIHVLLVAYQCNGEEFLAHLADRVTGDKEAMARILTEMSNLLPAPDPGGVTIRLHHSPVGWDEIQVNRDGTSASSPSQIRTQV